MKKFEYNGDVYYLINGKFVDEDFLELTTGKQAFVENAFYDMLNYNNVNEEQLLDLIREIRKCEKYDLCMVMCEYGLDKFKSNYNFAKQILATYTSCLRATNQSKQAIAFGESYLMHEQYQSSQLFTSLSAAYCDQCEINSNDNAFNMHIIAIAEKYINMASKLSGRNKQEELEITRVKDRIKILKEFTKV